MKSPAFARGMLTRQHMPTSQTSLDARLHEWRASSLLVVFIEPGPGPYYTCALLAARVSSKTTAA
eukprot:13870297-Alexandrium_andersonii.AAC.1